MDRRMFLSLVPILAMGCTKIFQDASKDSANPTAPTTPTVVTHDVEYRVLGDVPATITASNSQDGMDIIQSGLPWTQKFKITKDAFLYLEAKSLAFGTLHVQIFVDNVLFREAVSVAASNPFIAVSGTYHV